MNADEPLLREFVATRSEVAFREIVAAHLDAVYSVALRVLNGDSALAQDVAQTVFIDLSAKASSIRNAGALGAWLCRRAFFIASAKVREEQRRRVREREAVCMNEPAQPREAQWEEISGEIDELVQGLSAADREAIVLRYWHGWDLKKVGAALGVNDDAAQKRVGRALEKLRLGLAKRGFVLSATGLLGALSEQALSAAPAGLAVKVSTVALSGTSAGSGFLVTWLAATACLKNNALVCGAVVVVACAGLVMTLSRMSSVGSQEASRSPAAESRLVQASAPELGLQRPGATSFRWSEIEAPDLRQFAANLRAIGCPPQTIRDILISRLNREYAPRIRSIWKQEPSPYWKPIVQRNPSAEQLKAITQLYAEKESAFKELTGASVGPQQLVDMVHLQEGKMDAAMAYLPADRREAARKALLESGVEERVGSVGPHSDGREIFPDQMKALEGVLTAQELDEYRLRNSPRASWLRSDIAYFDCTVDEFRLLLDQIDAALAGKPDHLGVDRETALAQAREVFGDLRAIEYERVSDHGYRNTRGQADYARLPLDLADQAGQIAYEARLAVERAARDATLPLEQRRATIEAIESDAEQRLRSALGANAKPAILTSMRNTLHNTAAMGLR